MKPIFQPRSHILLMALAACYPVLGYGAGAVRLDFVVGSVVAVAPSGTQRPLAKGADVFSGETVRTGHVGRAQLRFDDGAMISLQPQSEFRLDDYQFSGAQNGQEKGFFSLLKGGFRTLTGLVGRANKDNYKVTTAVATIGIRGTEYTISYLDSNAISIATGEGSIEVCNGAGCVILRSGDSAIVEGPNSPLRLTDTRPRLDPPQIPQPLLAIFSTSEGRNPDGSLSVVPFKPMVSGPGYTMAFAGLNTSTNPFTPLSPDTRSDVTAQFDGSNTLTSATEVGAFTATTIAGGFSADGVIGWGRWSTGTAPLGFSSSLIGVKDLHYAVGKTTAASELTALAGLTATYNMIGYTLPTSESGGVGGAPSGTLTASFGTSLMSLSLNLTIPFGGVPHNFSGSTSSVVAPTFALDLIGTSSSFGTASGFFAGTNASHAGISYKVNTGSETVSGAAAFKR